MAAKEMWKLGETTDLDRIMWFFVAVVVFRLESSPLSVPQLRKTKDSESPNAEK